MPLLTATQYSGVPGAAQGGMVNMGDFLQRIAQAFQQRGGMNLPGAAGAAPVYNNPFLARTGRSDFTGIDAMRRGQQSALQPAQQGGSQSLVPSVQGAPQVENPLADVAPAAASSAGATQPLGNLLSPSAVQRTPRNMSDQRMQRQQYGGGLGRVARTSWQPFGPQGPRSFAMTAK